MENSRIITGIIVAGVQQFQNSGNIVIIISTPRKGNNRDQVI